MLILNRNSFLDRLIVDTSLPYSFSQQRQKTLVSLQNVLVNMSHILLVCCVVDVNIVSAQVVFEGRCIVWRVYNGWKLKYCHISTTIHEAWFFALHLEGDRFLDITDVIVPSKLVGLVQGKTPPPSYPQRWKWISNGRNFWKMLSCTFLQFYFCPYPWPRWRP